MSRHDLRRRKIVPLDILIGCLLICATGYIIYRVTVSLNYTWHWGTVPQYILRYDQSSGRWVPNYLLQGLFTTIRLSFWAGVFALIFGVFIALCRTGKRLFWRLIAVSYVGLMRNLPPLVIIFLFYFFFADQIIPLLGIEDIAYTGTPAVKSVVGFLFSPPTALSAFLSALMTLAVFEGAYIAEIIRAGIEAIAKEQWEAAHALGLTRYQTMRYIILPQAFRQVLPPLAGQFISLIKDSAIVSVISIQELTYQGTQLMASTYLTIEVWVTVALLYFLLTFPCSLLVSRLEKAYSC